MSPRRGKEYENCIIRIDLNGKSALEETDKKREALKPLNDLAPKLVQLYLDKAYTITHQGVLCWCPVPSDFTTGTVRVRMVALEATLAYIFAACLETSIDGIWDDLWPWHTNAIASKDSLTNLKAGVLPFLRVGVQQPSQPQRSIIS
ncbi:hypothetical protein CONLIGDRAFT_710183 [Coniochaeta ligniaria NRRL 30616]|uniref:Uncharacterized protein n=1 Tax=Coniochaeta ligniaria NRRL 30616 TaxID=1408157 RepID=A0A1J7JNE6_9PEZI|nr:hypothetical protein CONLIGDRAFT_710183 [Coniochaeta ligniaria NRRL 30616]